MRQTHGAIREKDKTMSELNLKDVINEALNEIEPTEVDNSIESQDEDLVDLELDEETESVDESDELEEESDIEEDEEDLEEGDIEDDEEAPQDGEAYVVKVDGEEYEVTLDELKAGYSRQAHFTKSMQALKEEREAFEAEIEQYQDTLGQLSALDEAWESNPVSVMTNLLGSTENPSYYLGLIIKEAAANDLLSAEALQYFGIDDETKENWSKESEVERLRREIQERDAEKEARLLELQEQATESRVQEAIQMFDRQIDEIIVDEDLDINTAQDRANFKKTVLEYAHENGILDLKKAYAALTYELSRKSKTSQQKRSASHAKKSATKVVSRRGAGGSGVSKVDNPKDLRNVIESTMREMQF